MIKNVADESQVKKGEQQSRLKRKEELNDVRFILETVQGRRFLTRVINFCVLDNNPYDNHAVKMAFNCGNQNVAQFLQKEIKEANSSGYLQMLKEEIERGKEYERE
jgi:hypothetical protein